MPHIIAVSTTDGKTIHRHFGRTEKFCIVSINDNNYSYIETREVEPCCNNFEHHESAFDKVLEILHDCEAVIVGKIGPSAYSYLTVKGMRVLEAPGFVDEVLTALCKNQDRFFTIKRMNTYDETC